MVTHRLLVVNVLSRESETQATIRYFCSRSVPQATGQPDVFWVAIWESDLIPKDLDNGRNATEREPAVAAVPRPGRPRGPDPVVIEPVVKIALAVGAEDTLMIVRDHRMSLFPLRWAIHTIGLEN